MGHYSTLMIGKQEFSWKYDIPSYLSFLFEETDLYHEKTTDEEDYHKIGFRTNCKRALDKLDKLGFDWDMITEIYSFFYNQIKEDVYQSIYEELWEKFDKLTAAALEKKIKSFYSKFPHFTREQELRDFVNFLLPLIEVSTGSKSMRVNSVDGKTYRITKEKHSTIFNNFLSEPGDFFYQKALVLPPWIQIIGNLFDPELLVEYAEIISVVKIKLLLEASDPETLVELQLEDMIESEEEISDFHVDSANRLISKIQLYNKFFNSIMNQEEVIKDAYFKKELLLLLDRIPLIKSSAEKGRALENLTEIVFSSIPGLEVIEKRVRTQDEEIDLQIKNDVAGTFWTSLTSPSFFVECKNWSGKVGASEVRDFEIKIMNHKKLVKVGFFISFNGFTKEVDNALKRASREDHHIVLIDSNDLYNLVNSKNSTMEWLEKLIIKPH
jgi:hypothetical protein